MHFEDDHYGGPVRPTTTQQTADTPLFAARIDPPSVPRASSERGADHVKQRRTQITQASRIMLALWKAGCVPGSGKFLSRDEIADRCDMRATAACGRLGPSGGLAVEASRYDAAHPTAVIAMEDAAVSAAGLKVNGYQLSAYGERLCRHRTERVGAT